MAKPLKPIDQLGELARLMSAGDVRAGSFARAIGVGRTQAFARLRHLAELGWVSGSRFDDVVITVSGHRAIDEATGRQGPTELPASGEYEVTPQDLRVLLASDRAVLDRVCRAHCRPWGPTLLRQIARLPDRRRARSMSVRDLPAPEDLQALVDLPRETVAAALRLLHLGGGVALLQRLACDVCPCVELPAMPTPPEPPIEARATAVAAAELPVVLGPAAAAPEVSKGTEEHPRAPNGPSEGVVAAEAPALPPALSEGTSKPLHAPAASARKSRRKGAGKRTAAPATELAIEEEGQGEPRFVVRGRQQVVRSRHFDVVEAKRAMLRDPFGVEVARLPDGLIFMQKERQR
jgi:hypothetical protein